MQRHICQQKNTVAQKELNYTKYHLLTYSSCHGDI